MVVQRSMAAVEQKTMPPRQLQRQLPQTELQSRGVCWLGSWLSNVDKALMMWRLLLPQTAGLITYGGLLSKSKDKDEFVFQGGVLVRVESNS